MNIHIKPVAYEQKEYVVDKVYELLYKYDCEQHAYIMTSDQDIHKIFMEKYPIVRRCMGATYGNEQEHLNIVDKAIEYKCEKVQFYKPYFKYFDKSMIEKAHAHGIKCNVFWSDDQKETLEFLQMGMDTILTNDYLKIANVVKKWKEKRK